MTEADLEQYFPHLTSTGYHVTSPATPDYNCIAWAAESTANPWWPIDMAPYYWPADIPNPVTVQSFVDAFRVLGYEPCEDGEYETGFEKVAIYADQNGEPTHMARQLNSGAWTSKLGSLEDIEHAKLSGIEEATYGHVVLFLKRMFRSKEAG
jgi:hypothetical protein